MVQQHAVGSAPPEIQPDDNLTTRLWRQAAEQPDTGILRYHDATGWRTITWGDLFERVRDVAAGLLAVGVQPGDRVALMSPTRYEWTVCDLAILAAGGVTVPIYETSSADQCAWVLADSGAKVAIAGGADQAKNIDAARDRAAELGELFVIDDDGLLALAERADDATHARVDAVARSRRLDDLASLIYTSGTTGKPKGCELTHRNLLFIARSSAVTLRTMLAKDESTLLFLPLAHVFARLIQFLCLESDDVLLGYARSIETLSEDLQSFSPTFLLAVPRVFEKVYNTAQRKAEGPKRKIFDFAVATAVAWSVARNEGRDPGIVTNLKHAVADKLVYAKLRHAIGGRAHHAVSGGAPLSPHLAHFFHAAGITILEGYGLTETSAPSTVNTPDALRIGTVGRPLPGVEIAIADDGEILIKGDHVFAGYYHDPQATSEVLTDDGWFHSGDIGELDDDGYLRITGRKKELIVTAGGKNVAPALLEERLKAHRLVSQAMVVGDAKPFIAALVTLEPDELAAFAAEHGLSGTAAELAEDPLVRAEIDKAVAYANEAVSKAESIRKVNILPRDFTQEEGELTPTLKLRRPVVADHFADAIDSLYARQ